MVRLLLLGVVALGPVWASASSIDTTQKRVFLQKVVWRVYLRASLEQPLQVQNKSSFKLNEARLEWMGTLWKGLTFRVRFHLYPSGKEFTLSQSNNNISYACFSYRFGGAAQRFEITVGKQNNSIGSFKRNPVFEYQYSSIGGGRTVNNFPVGVRLTYTNSTEHLFTIQIHNTLPRPFTPLPATQAFLPFDAHA